MVHLSEGLYCMSDCQKQDMCLVLLFLNIVLFFLVCRTGYLVYQKEELEEYRKIKVPIIQETIKPELKPKTKWSKEEWLSWHSTRYGTCINKKNIPITFISGENKGKPLSKKEFEATIREVFRRLPHVKTSDHLVALMLETSIAESHMGGLDVKKNKKSSAIGIFQVLPRTYRDTWKWLDANHKDVLASIMRFYDFSKTEQWNLTHNVPFGIAVSVTYYWRMNPNLYSRIDTVEKRGKIWADTYNTPLDPLGTKEYYVRKAKLLKEIDNDCKRTKRKTVRDA